MKNDIVLLEKKGGVALVTLNRPDKLNAFNPRLSNALAKTLQEVAEDRSVKAVIIAGNGRSFCAGGDIIGHPIMKTSDVVIRKDIVHKVQRIPFQIRRMDKPVIAAINGYATGAGCDLALMCDMRIASEDAKFSEVYVTVGLMPDIGGTYFLPRLVGTGKAIELLLTGDTIDAQEALRIGLVNKVVPKETLLEEAEKLAGRFAKGPTISYRFIKHAVYNNLTASLKEALERERVGQAILIGTQDVKNAVKAFSEKRSPTFEGR